MKKFLRIFFIALPALALLYFLGPAPAKPVYTTTMPQVPAQDAAALETFVALQEMQHKIKPDNEARIVWYNDSLKQPTEYALVYLHGFSASQEEGNPTHRSIAKSIGANLYLSRLAEHGIDTTDELVNYTPEGLWQSALKALAIGRQLGKKVILMGTSTGGSVALQLAAIFPTEVAALILISPNIRINDANAWMLNNHWGLQVARMVLGGNTRTVSDSRPIYKQYWNYQYRIESLVALQEYLETAMIPKTFKQVHQPVLTLAYYKNEQEQDDVVKVSAMRQMHRELGSDSSRKKLVELSTTGNHVQGSPIKSKDVPAVENEIKKFLQQVMHLPLQ